MFFVVFFFIFVFLSAEIALAFALRAGDETRQGDLTNVATAPRGECLPRQEAGGLGDFFRKKRKRSGAFSSPLKKLCLFIRRKELRILAGRLGTFAEEELESCHGCWARVPGPGVPAGGGAPRPGLCPRQPPVVLVSQIGVLGDLQRPGLCCGWEAQLESWGGSRPRRHSCVSVKKGSESLELSSRRTTGGLPFRRWWVQDAEA